MIGLLGTRRLTDRDREPSNTQMNKRGESTEEAGPVTKKPRFQKKVMEVFNKCRESFKNLREEGGFSADGKGAWQGLKKLAKEMDARREEEMKATLSRRSSFREWDELLEIHGRGDSVDETGRCADLDDLKQHCLFMTTDILLSKDRSFHKFCQLAVNIGQAEGLSIDSKPWFDGMLYFDDESLEYLEELLPVYLPQIDKVLAEIREY